MEIEAREIAVTITARFQTVRWVASWDWLRQPVKSEPEKTIPTSPDYPHLMPRFVISMPVM